MTRVLIVLSASQVGGMEKRLAGLFLHLAGQGRPVRLVAARQLLGLLRGTPETRALADHEGAIVPFDGDERWFDNLRSTTRRLATAEAGAVFHYGLVPPLRAHPLRASTRRVLYTIPNASLRQYNVRGLVEVWGGVMRAAHVDVLDPHVCRQLQAAFPWRRSSFSNTPGSFVDLDVFRALPGIEKRDRIVFSGLFTHEKQAPRLAAALPRMLELLERAGLGHVEIWMLGRAQEGDVPEIVNGLGDPRVRAFHSNDPQSVLAESKVFLSLQRSTNHPSKALLEAMACGCAPVVTDTRDSRLTAPDSLARYVPRDFTAEDLVEAAMPLLRRSAEEIDRATAAMRAHLAQRFSLTAMAEYYCGLYEALARR
jgi:glycosyltransferase involved in cell wall biosynthesis